MLSLFLPDFPNTDVGKKTVFAIEKETTKQMEVQRRMLDVLLEKIELLKSKSKVYLLCIPDPCSTHFG